MHRSIFASAVVALVLSSLPGPAGCRALLPASGHRRQTGAGERPLRARVGRGWTNPSSPRVALYGDSLAWEAAAPFRAVLAAAGIKNVTVRTMGGTAICDWLTQMRADAASLRPAAVIIEFSGNALTPCMESPSGRPLTGETYFVKYAADARHAAATFAPRARVYLVGSPISRRAELSLDPTTRRLDRIYAGLTASTPNAFYIDAAAAVTFNGHWTQTLPCLVGELCTGGTDTSGTPVDVVRSPDGTHFCPVATADAHGVTSACPIYSSGAYRYGTAMAEPVAHDFAASSEPAEVPPVPPGSEVVL